MTNEPRLTDRELLDIVDSQGLDYAICEYLNRPIEHAEAEQLIKDIAPKLIRLRDLLQDIQDELDDQVEDEEDDYDQ